MKRGYSREFPVLRGEGKRFTLTDIPAGFWSRVRAKARAERVSMRGLILQLLKAWLDAPPVVREGYDAVEQDLARARERRGGA